MKYFLLTPALLFAMAAAAASIFAMYCEWKRIDLLKEGVTDLPKWTRFRFGQLNMLCVIAAIILTIIYLL